MGLKDGVGLHLQTNNKMTKHALAKEKPLFLLLSPRCSAFSRLCEFSLDSETYQEILVECLDQFLPSITLMRLQLKVGRFVLFGHPLTAWSWDVEALVQLREDFPQFVRHVGAQCVVQKQPYIVKGEVGFSNKPTGRLTNCEGIGKELNLPCPGGHHHIQLIGGKAFMAEEYSPQTSLAVLRGLSKYAKTSKVFPEVCALSFDSGSHIDEAAMVDDSVSYYDNISGALLDLSEVEGGRKAEIDFMMKLDVYDVVPLKQCYDRIGGKPILVGWVDVGKSGDCIGVRCRLVARETPKATTLDADTNVFSSVPPVESLRVTISLGATLLPLNKMQKEVYAHHPPEDPRCIEDCCA